MKDDYTARDELDALLKYNRFRWILGRRISPYSAFSDELKWFSEQLKLYETCWFNALTKKGFYNEINQKV